MRREGAIGYALSVLLTLIAYWLVAWRVLEGSLLLAIGGLGGLQAAVQLRCFLHVGEDVKPRWNSMLFLFMVLVVIIIIGGTIWIMENLKYNLM